MPDPGGCTLSRLDLLLTTLSGNNLSIVELKEALAEMGTEMDISTPAASVRGSGSFAMIVTGRS